MPRLSELKLSDGKYGDPSMQEILAQEAQDAAQFEDSDRPDSSEYEEEGEEDDDDPPISDREIWG